MTQSDWELFGIFEQRIVQSDLNVFVSVSVWRWGGVCMCECVCVCACVRECICMCVFGADAHEDQRITMLGCHSSGIVHLKVFLCGNWVSHWCPKIHLSLPLQCWDYKVGATMPGLFVSLKYGF